jgi:tRNA dimethylallyltransferase
MASELKSEAPIFLVGATGVGKSAVAMELARGFGNAAILCMDAMQVYRGADIGTSKPTAAERAEIPHGGLDLVEFNANFDVAQYLKHAETFLREQSEAGRGVIIVGGTGLYFRALTRGLCDAPQGSEELRAELNGLSVAELQKRLKAIDPEMLERIDAANPRRLVRAIEVKVGTGRSLREWQEETPEPLVKEFKAIWIQREKEELNARIEARVEGMFSEGWVEEVRRLVGKFGAAAVRNFPGIGYGEIVEMLKEADPITKLAKLPNLERREGSGTDRIYGEEGTGAGPAPATLEKVKRDICVATRQYARRQLTWFAREPNLEVVMLTGTSSTSAVFSTLL